MSTTKADGCARATSALRFWPPACSTRVWLRAGSITRLLSGVGTKAIPISRPQIMVSLAGSQPTAHLVIRDEERGSKVSVASITNFSAARWTVRDLTADSTGAWEPSFDTELWRTKGELNLFLQAVQQVDGEGAANVSPSKVRVLQWRPLNVNAYGR